MPHLFLLVIVDSDGDTEAEEAMERKTAPAVQGIDLQRMINLGG